MQCHSVTASSICCLTEDEEEKEKKKKITAEEVAQQPEPCFFMHDPVFISCLSQKAPFTPYKCWGVTTTGGHHLLAPDYTINKGLNGRQTWPL